MAEPSSEESLTSLPDQLPILSKSSSSHEDEIEVPKPKYKKRPGKISKKLEAILKPRIVAKQKYFTSASTVNAQNAKDLDKEPSPFAYPSELEEFAHKVRTKAWREDVRIRELKKKCAQRPSYKDRQRADLLRRLYVEEPVPQTMKTVLDLDPEYFMLVEGRPIPDKLDIRSYIGKVRESLRTKIITGYREDDIMLIEENLILEQKMIDSIKENYQTYVNTFEEFLYMDHTSAMKLLKDSEECSQEAYNLYLDYRNLQKKYGAMRSSLYNSEAKWRNCKKYQRFLYVVSPMSWRAKTTFCRGSIYLKDEDEDDEDDIFGKYRLSLASREASLTELIEHFKCEWKKEGSATLYFTSPDQLMDVFRFMEMQNLNSLLHSEELAIPLVHVREGMRYAEEVFDSEIKSLQEAIERLAGGISWEEERARYLEELGKKLIEGDFKKLTIDEEVLNLHVFVEDVYETRVGANDANLSMVEMMRGIEEKYRHELLLMDKAPAEQIAILEGSCYEDQLRVMKLAEKAARQYAELERLTYTLNRAYAPPFKKPEGKELKNRSPLKDKPPIPPPPARDLTENEEEYLEFFTDFCKYTDDPKAYGIDTRASAARRENEEPPDERFKKMSLGQEDESNVDVIQSE